MPTIRECDTSPLSALAARDKPTPDQIKDLIEGMKTALRGAHSLNYYQRMEQNHDARYCWWVGQSIDGRKWSKEKGSKTGRRRVLPGEVPEEVFPFEGASDARVRLIDTVIRERVGFMRLALQRRQERLGPRDMSPDADPQSRAALWSQVLNYFEDFTRRQFRRATARWASIAQEYGHSLLFVGWHSDAEVIPKRLSIEEVTTVFAQTALQVAEEQMLKMHTDNGGAEEDAPTLSKEESQKIIQDAAQRIDSMRDDPKQKEAFVGLLLQVDPAMPKMEAMRLATELRYGEEADYHAIDPKDEHPEYRALTTGIDVLFPATIEGAQSAPWIDMLEWVTKAELKSRIDTDDYDEGWVNAVLEKGPGRSFDFTELQVDSYSWLMSGGAVRSSLQSSPTVDSTQDMYQIHHVFYRATALGNARAMYRTILHPAVLDKYASHECCPYAHGRYPFFDTLMEADAPYLLASRGAGELTDTLQDTAKTTVDEIRDSASMRAKPPMLVPQNQEGRVAWHPGLRIPVRNTTAGMGLYQPLNTGSDTSGSTEVHTINMDLFNEFWARGPKVDPEVKFAARQLMVSDFLEDVREARVMAFQLIQEFAPDELKAAFVGGLNVNLQATREDIQGMVSMELDFDVNDFDTSKTKEFMESWEILMRMDTKRLLNNEPMLKALAARLVPATYKTLVENTDKRAAQERDDEKRIITEILSGTQTADDERASYYPGDHQTRMQFINEMFGFQTDAKGNILSMQAMGQKGQPTRAQTLFNEDSDIQARVINRLRFHARQLGQEQNALTGARQVEPVTQEAA